MSLFAFFGSLIRRGTTPRVPPHRAGERRRRAHRGALKSDGASVPIKKLTTVGGEFLAWAEEGKVVTFALGRTMFRYDLAAAKTAEDAQKQREAKDKAAGADEKKPADDKKDDEKAERKKPAYEPTATEIVVEAPRTKPSGTIALRGARDHHDAAVRDPAQRRRGFRRPHRHRRDRARRHRDHEQPDRGGRPERSGRIPAGAKTIDVAGKTIMPGLVDVARAHVAAAWAAPDAGLASTSRTSRTASRRRAIRRRRRPTSSPTRDMVETRQILGPRIYATGPGVFSSDNVQSLDEARDVHQALQRVLRTRKTIKQYMAGNRQQRQWIIDGGQGARAHADARRGRSTSS